MVSSCAFDVGIGRFLCTFFFSRNPWAFLQGLTVNHRLGTPNEAAPTAKTSDMGPVLCLNLLGIL